MVGSCINDAFRLAASHGHLHIVKFILQLDDGRLSKEAYNYALHLSAENGHESIVEFLLSLNDPDINTSIALQWAASQGHFNLVCLLLQDERTDPFANENEALLKAAKHGHVDIVSLLIQMGSNNMSRECLYKATLQAIEHGHLNVVQYLVSLYTWSDENQHKALVLAASSGHDTLFIYLASLFPPCNETLASAFEQATLQGHTRVVEYMWTTYRSMMDPSRDHCLLFRHAAAKGYTRICQLLIQDARVDPCIFHNEAFQQAASHGHMDMVKWIASLQHPGFDPSANHHYAIRYAALRGYTEMVQLVLTMYDSHQAEAVSLALTLAIQKGHFTLVHWLSNTQPLHYNVACFY
jgi:ankyrin repeat protein